MSQFDLSISAIILTKDESIHIERCINNIKAITSQIWVVDSYSSDGTQEIARKLGANVVEHRWPGCQAKQFNWALENLPIDTEWILRIDADEYLLPELIDEIVEKVPKASKEITGVVLKRRHIFLNKWVKHGIYPVKLLRLFRKGRGFSEGRIMDEHIVLSEGDTLELEHDFCDHNLNSIGWFCEKHVNYAIREAAESLNLLYGFSQSDSSVFMTSQAQQKRNKKLKYYSKPLFVRSFIYFLYRYIIKGGWRDGKEGFLFAFIQGWWYRTLVDANIYQIQKKARGDKRKVRDILMRDYGIEF
jgi:glycosyltransferase involved in cell wall biosynthesis